MLIHTRRYLVAVAALAAVGCDDPTPGGRAGLSSSPVEQEGMRLVASLPAGRGDGEVTIRPPQEEAHAGGPSALAVGPGGVVHIADTLADRIVRLRPDGSALTSLPAPAVEDLLVDGDGLVYAFSRRDSRVAVIDGGGQLIDVVEIPGTMRWVTGLCLRPDGRVALRTGYQESVALDAQHLQRDLSEGVPGLDGGRYRALRRDGAARIERVRRGAERIVVDSRLDLDVATPLGSLTFLGATAAGELVVDVQDVVGEAPVTVERSVRRYSPSGDLLAEREVPRGIYAPAHALELAADGAVYALRPTLDGVEVWGWAARGGAR